MINLISRQVAILFIAFRVSLKSISPKKEYIFNLISNIEAFNKVCTSEKCYTHWFSYIVRDALCL